LREKTTHTALLSFDNTKNVLAFKIEEEEEEEEEQSIGSPIL